MHSFFRELVETLWSRLRRTPDHVLSGPLAEIPLQKGDIVIDCGANVGDVTVPLAEKGATVYAFEPNPHAFRVLKQRTAKFPDVHCFNQGVLDRPASLKLYLHQNAGRNQVKWANGSSLLAFKGNVNPETSVDIEVIDLAAFIETLNSPVKLLKMDVEGVECPILNRLIDAGLIHRIAHVFVETHDDKIPELRAETDALRKRIVDAGLTHVDLGWI